VWKWANLGGARIGGVARKLSDRLKTFQQRPPEPELSDGPVLVYPSLAMLGILFA
jgi:hypothetical protein